MTIKYVHNIWSCLVSATRVNSPCITVMLTLKQMLIASGVTLLHGRVVIHTYSTKLCSVIRDTSLWHFSAVLLLRPCQKLVANVNVTVVMWHSKCCQIAQRRQWKWRVTYTENILSDVYLFRVFWMCHSVNVIPPTNCIVVFLEALLNLVLDKVNFCSLLTCLCSVV